MADQQQTKVVSLRPGIIVVVIVVLVSVVGLIIFNLSITMNKMHAHNDKKSNKGVHAVASEADTSWYQHETISKTTIVEKNHSKKSDKSIEASTEFPVSTDVVNHIKPLTQSEKDVIEAMKASITSNQLTNQQAGVERIQGRNQASQDSALSSLPEEHDPNLQNEKSSFISQHQQSEDDYLHSMLKDPISPYELQAGTIIPGILITGINSDLPGQITGQVQSNVYDSISGKHLLIPQGAKIKGVYDSKVAYGQARVLVVWQRIIYPNGQSLNLEGMPGIDMSGYAGFRDLVDNHYMKLLGSVVLMSLLASGAQLSQPQQTNNPFAGPTVGQTLAESLGTNIADVGTAIVSKDLNIQPTLEIRPGYEFNISVTKDIVFIKPYDA